MRSRLRRTPATEDRRLNEVEQHETEDGFDAYGKSRAIFAFAGMGALLGLLLGGTTVGFPIAIASTIIGGVGGGILGRYLKTDG